MNFEWDAMKNEANITKHGVGFGEATGIFHGRVLERLDSRRDYGETRIIATGIAEGRELVVVYTRRGEVRRIISARKANQNERRAYRQVHPG